MATLQEKFSARLGTLRAEKGFSPENMAEMLKISMQDYIDLEEGKTSPSLNEIEEIARILEMDISALLPTEFSSTIINSGENSGSGSSGNSGNMGAFLVFPRSSSEANTALLEKLIDRIVKLETELAVLKGGKL